MRNLLELLSAYPFTSVSNRANPLILGLAYDSREVRPGYLFFALAGIHTDGQEYVSDAVRRGAVAVVHDDRYRAPESVVGLGAANPRLAMSALAAEFFRHPSRKLVVVGITGTDGKSTTVYLTAQLLEAAGFHTGFLSTVAFRPANLVEKNPFRQSTPEAPLVHEMLGRMLQNGKTHAVVEATSHGLSEKTARLAHVEFDGAAVTNVTHEHLEFHGSYAQYLSDKTNLFRSLDRERTKTKAARCFATANMDDESYPYLVKEAPVPVIGYSRKNPNAEFFAHALSADAGGTTFTLLHGGRSRQVRLNLPGAFNVENLLAALALVTGVTGAALPDLLAVVPDLEGVAGRMQPVRRGQPFQVLVDYAHTPGAFERLFPQAKSATGGRLIAVFGSAGERDTTKRPIQGRIAAGYADLVILADEDPRLEDSIGILEEIAAGCVGKTRGENLLLVPDRREAIRRAFVEARAGDMVLLLGKGHEQSIIYADGPRAWDEAAVAREELEALGYCSKD